MKGAILMKKFVRIIAFMLLTLFCSTALAQAPDAIPLKEISATQVEPPPEIQQVLDIAYAQWQETAGKNLTDKNKFTEWRGKGYKFQWCGGYVTWCMLEAGIPMMTLGEFQSAAKQSDDRLVLKDGLYHCKEALPSKILSGYQYMERVTAVPQKGFIIIYGTSWNETVHTALVYDVEELGEGKFRITTLEGNVKNNGTPNSITMYVRDYDMNVEVNVNAKKSTNLTAVPEDERTVEGADYTLMEGVPASGYKSQMYYVYCFLMPWVPGDPALSTPVPTSTPEPTPAPTAEPTATPAPTVEPTAEPTEEAAAVLTPAEEDAPVIADVIVLTPPPAATPAPETTAEPEVTEAPTTEPTATPAPTAEPTAEPAAEATATPAPTAAPAADPTFPCQGEDGQCIYVTRSADDPFCRKCDRNDNGVEDSKE